MSNAEGFSFDFHIPGEEQKRIGTPGIPARITKSQMVAWLRKSGLDEETRESLIDEVKMRPGNTMVHFYRNLHKYIARIHEDRKKNS